MPPPKLRVFWDLDSCRPPATYSTPWDVISDVRLFTSNFGNATDIRAYWDGNRDGSKGPASESLRAAMPSMGVNLVDCSLMQGYTEDALTRRLTVDVLTLAIDEPVSTNTPSQDIIVILSGDESLLYPISLLMFRNYTIFLVVPDDCSNVQPSQATRVFNWQRDVLGTRIEESTAIPEAVAAPEAPPPPPPPPPPPATTMENKAWIVYGKRVPQRPVKLDITPAATQRSGSRSTTSPGPPLPTHIPSPLSWNSTRINVVESRPSSAKDTQANTDASGYRVSMSPPLSPPISPPSEPKEPARSGTYGGWDANGQWTAGGWDMEPEPEPSETPKSDPSITRGRGSGHQQEGSIDEMEGHTGHPLQPPREVPLSVFDPLLHILREAKRRSMGRSKLGEEMARYKSVYKEAGVRNLNEYISLAVKRELVIAGGIENHQYVRLHPKFKKNEVQ